MQYYQVTGKRFLTEQDLDKLFSTGRPTHIRKEGEKGLGRTITSEDQIEDAWIVISITLQNEESAIEYARKCVQAGLNGSCATVKTSSQPFFSERNHDIIYEVRKENKKITEIDYR